jgi:LmbE family N-acetylglucosaminyl deacetylase
MPSPPEPGPVFGRRILILIPHPDDEVAGVCAAIGRAKAAGARVHGLYLTHGCLGREAMWPWERRRHAALVARRRAEAEAGASLLGLEPAGWSARPARQLWRELPDAEAEARAAIARLGVDQLWAPAFEGGNPDHDGASALAARLARDGLPVLEFAEYNLAGGRAHSQTFPVANNTETVLALTPQEQAQKRRALRLYVSERSNLGYVGTAEERLRPLAPYDYSRPPHAGTLWYARFQWVPFAHPRVDFTRPDEVAAALVAYLGEGASSPLRAS